MVGYYHDSDEFLAALGAGIFVQWVERLLAEDVDDLLGEVRAVARLYKRLGRLHAERVRDLLARRWESRALTPTQARVLELIRMGYGNDAIARRLGIRTQTAKNHVSDVLRRLGANSRYELVARSSGTTRCRECPLVPRSLRAVGR